MKILDRYIGMAVLVTGGFAVGVLSIVLVLGNIFKRLLDLLVNHDVPLDFILSFIAYVLPFSLSFTIPWGFLTAVLLVFGRLSAEYELTALRACGVSIQRTAVPVFILAALCSLLCLWINVDVAPKAQTKMKNALFEIATSNPIALFGSDQVIEEFPGRKIYVSKKEGNELRDIVIFELDEADIPVRVVHADRGVLMADQLRDAATNPEAREIQLQLYDVRYEQRDEKQPDKIRLIRHGITMEQGVMAISLKELYEKNEKRKGLSSMTLSELRDDLERRQDRSSESAARTEVSKRFSFSMACIAFALIAVPLGITTQRRETSIGFALSLVIAFVYFLFIIVADFLRNNAAARPDLLVWLPNVIFMALGAYLFLRLSRK